MRKPDLLRLPRALFQLPGRILFRARARRALTELVAIQVVFALIVPLFLHMLIDKELRLLARNIYQANFLALYMFCATYSGLSACWLALRWRLRPSHRSRKKQFLLEVLIFFLLFGELLVSVNILTWGLGTVPIYAFLHPFLSISLDPQSEIFNMPYSEAYVMYSTLIVSSCSVLFFALRLLSHLLNFWNRLRRRHLLWALTHAHLMILIWGALIVYLLAILIASANYNAARGATPVEMFIATSILIGAVILFLTVVGVVFVLPPSALFSYLFSRRIVRRIKDLAGATSSLRAGNYHIRVKVDGEDEVARLQADFNVMAEELERTLHELQEERDTVSTLLQARRELIASVSHELRTPVATVRSYLESTLSGWKDAPPPTLRQDLQVMEQQVVRLQLLIQDLFTLARAEVGRLEMRSLPVNVELLVRRVVDTMAPVVWRGSRIEVLADIAPVLPAFPRVLADENRLEQILQNLLHNAVRHTSPGGIIVVSAAAEDQSVILQVKDTGEGIPPEELEWIWQRFYRGGNVGNQPGSGSGLGLSIVKDLTEAMGGTVAVASMVGEGSVFTVRLPRIGTGTLLAPETYSLAQLEKS